MLMKAFVAPQSFARCKSPGMSVDKPGIVGAMPMPTWMPASARVFIASKRALGEGANGSTARAVS